VSASEQKIAPQGLNMEVNHARSPPCARKARRISNRRRANGAMETGLISIRLQRRNGWNARPIDSTDRRNIMPLKNGSSQSVVSSNIKTLVDEWKKDGSIGTSHPPTKKKAIKQAVAIAMAKAGKSRNTQPRTRKVS